MTTYIELEQELAALKVRLSLEKYDEMMKLTDEHLWHTDAEVPEEVADKWRKAYADAIAAHTPPEMRQPTSEEMIAGIARAFDGKLDQLVYDCGDERSDFGKAFRVVASRQLAEWLAANTNKLVAAIATKCV